MSSPAEQAFEELYGQEPDKERVGPISWAGWVDRRAAFLSGAAWAAEQERERIAKLAELRALDAQAHGGYAEDFQRFADEIRNPKSAET